MLGHFHRSPPRISADHARARAASNRAGLPPVLRQRCNRLTFDQPEWSGTPDVDWLQSPSPAIGQTEIGPAAIGSPSRRGPDRRQTVKDEQRQFNRFPTDHLALALPHAIRPIGRGALRSTVFGSLRGRLLPAVPPRMIITSAVDAQQRQIGTDHVHHRSHSRAFAEAIRSGEIPTMLRCRQVSLANERRSDRHQIQSPGYSLRRRLIPAAPRNTPGPMCQHIGPVRQHR
jgi:hypothetical protein